MLFMGKLLSQYHCQYCNLRSVGGVAGGGVKTDVCCIHTDVL